MLKINFQVVSYRHNFLNTPNTCFLIADSWDDFGYKTTFELIYTPPNSVDIKKIGYLKVMVKGQDVNLNNGQTLMPEGVFSVLPEGYCSLGNTQGYYEELMGLEKDIREQILFGLRDCVYDLDIYKVNKDENVMKHSLLRNNDEHDVTRFYKSILEGSVLRTPYHFDYLINEDENLKISVNVRPYSNPPSNVHVLIGRNGAGKTRILSGLADELTQNSNPARISQKGKLVFPSEIVGVVTGQSFERFSNLVTVVFSAFDHFKPIRNDNAITSVDCTYVGLKNDSGNAFKSQDELNKEFMDSVKVCLGGQRKTRWMRAINTLSSDSIFSAYGLQNFNSQFHFSELQKIFDELSSGHKIILLTIARLVELVDDRTLVLMDEPENHLHPPLLSSFLRAVSDLLIERNAVGLIATHSPVVLQEVPRSCVTKIDRVKSKYSLTRPRIETYGENIDTLTRDVFRLELEDSGFYKTIKDYIEEKDTDFEHFTKAFENKVGSEGRALARSIVFHRGKKDA